MSKRQDRPRDPARQRAAAPTIISLYIRASFHLDASTIFLVAKKKRRKLKKRGKGPSVAGKAGATRGIKIRRTRPAPRSWQGRASGKKSRFEWAPSRQPSLPPRAARLATSVPRARPRAVQGRTPDSPRPVRTVRTDGLADGQTRRQTHGLRYQELPRE